MNEVKKNFIYNIVYQIFIFIIPMITVPYVSRVLGTDGVGIYSYTYSIIYYFMIFAMLGLNNYGNRTIAKCRDDKTKLTKTFKEIHLFQILSSTVMIVLYALYILLFCKKYYIVALIQILHLISCVFDINWFFFGIEKFKLTVTRNTLIKILSLILIFIFVRSENDLWIYTLICSGSILLSQLALWPFVNNYIGHEKIMFKNCLKHIKPCCKLFLPVIAVAIYRMMDKTMLGLMKNVTEVGLYEQAEKIINVPNAIITALGTVMLPRMSNLYSKGKDKEVEKIIDKSINFMMFMAFAMTFGLIAIAKDFALWFLGEKFVDSGILIIYLSITVIFMGWGNVIRTQYLIPKERDKEYITSAFLGAIINAIINYLLIPKYSAVGACIGTIIAEFVVMLYQTLAVRKELPIIKYIKESLPFLIKGLIMFILILLVNKLNINNILVKLIIQVIVGVVSYVLLNVKYIKSMLNIREKSK